MNKDNLIELCESCKSDPAFCAANVGDFKVVDNEIVECIKYETE
jgi:hypothetical protein